MTDDTPMIQLDAVRIRSGDFTLHDVSFAVPRGTYAVVMGRSGSGKTTLLEAICGLRRVVKGRVLLDGAEVTDWRPAARQIGLVPQEGALFESMTVFENLALPLRVRGWSTADLRARVDEVAASLGLVPLLRRRPRGLSGGERQRVALGRALSFRPRVLCLDEPLSALDEDTREEAAAVIAATCRQAGATTLHVTHSRVEAERLGDMLLRIDDGRVNPVAMDTVTTSAPTSTKDPS